MSTTNKEPWINYPHIWKTKAAFLSFIRGGIRRALWNKSPIKLEFIKKYRKRIKNPNPKGRVAEVWGGTCSLCKQDFPTQQLNVDHKVGNNSLKDLSELQSFVEAIVLVQENDLQFVCLPCHKIKNLQERTGTDFESARITKEVIAIMNSKTDRQWLEQHGIIPQSNAKLRREQIEKEMKNES